MKSSRTTKSRRFLVVFAIALVAGVSFYLASRPRSLLDHATQYRAVNPTETVVTSMSMMATTTTPPTPPRNSVVPMQTETRLAWKDYVWLSDNTVRAIGNALTAPQLQLVDVKTGDSRPCLIEPPKPGIRESINFDQLSPDGRYVSADQSVLTKRVIGTKVEWSQDETKSSRCIVEIDNSRRIPISPQLERFMWRSDSKGWLRHTDFGVVTGFGQLSPSREEAINSTGRNRKFWWYSGDIAAGQTLTEDTPPEWLEVDVRTGKQQFVSLHIPRNASVLDARLSPDGQRVIWEMGISPTYLDQVLQSIGIVAKPDLFKSIGLYVSRPDGAEMRLLGTTPTDYNPVQGMLMARWLPDSRHVSFLFKGKLYSISTE